jgi:hypothetical protein
LKRSPPIRLEDDDLVPFFDRIKGVSLKALAPAMALSSDRASEGPSDLGPSQIQAPDAAIRTFHAADRRPNRGGPEDFDIDF